MIPLAFTARFRYNTHALRLTVKEVHILMEKSKPLFSTERITYIALLVAMQVVLGNVTQLPSLGKQFNFGFLPIAVAGALFGYPAAMIVGGLGDFFGAHLFPVGAYFYGFTLTNIAVGAAYALALHGQKASVVRAAVASAMTAACYLFLNSFWLSVLYSSKTYWGWVIARAPSYLVEIPACAIMIYFTVKGLQKLPASVTQADKPKEKACAENSSSKN